ncbi:hypothetical protein ACTFIZ_002668 [Dictyostelium cf. discoideum]
MYFYYCINENKEEYPENDRLFFKIWRNKFILNKILFHLKISNNYISERIFEFGDLLNGSFTSNPFKDYFKSLVIKDDSLVNPRSNPPSIFKTSFLPHSITDLKVTIYQSENSFIINDINNNINN